MGTNSGASNPRIHKCSVSCVGYVVYHKDTLHDLLSALLLPTTVFFNMPLLFVSDQFDMEEIDHGITAISHTALESGVGDDNGDTPSSGPHSPTVSWASGSCTRIGGKRTNEDRYVAIPDVSATATKPGGIRNETVKVATTLLPGVDLKETSFGSTGALGYFAVYDGHDGEDAAELMSRSLHLRILG